MGKCYIEIDGSPPELLYESQTDGKGHFVEDIYRNRESFNYYWAKMSDNISRTLRGILIQQPELIPIVAKIMEEEENKKKLSNTLTLGDNKFEEDK